MHRRYFPSCTVDGPIDPPTPFGHLGASGAVPNKCGTCDKLFEGECTRYIEEIGHYLHLDYGSCGINGPTDPITYEDDFITSKVEIPRKCADCVFLGIDRIHGFHCKKDSDKWGDFHRGLDWGRWKPDCIYLQLPLPKVTTQALAQFAQRNDMKSFIKEYRRINPGLSIKEAKADFAHFRNVLENR
ncbi:MAG: hypothetical protein JSV31_14860 [Desulfobacterales bacterium]|nr:MAG: hypothetical protein JSV31_14860 [Desulfobacterales bacterium]